MTVYFRWSATLGSGISELQVTDLIGSRTNEHFIGINLNCRIRLPSFATIAVGGLSACPVQPHDLFRTALATQIIAKKFVTIRSLAAGVSRSRCVSC